MGVGDMVRMIRGNQDYKLLRLSRPSCFGSVIDAIQSKTRVIVALSFFTRGLV